MKETQVSATTTRHTQQQQQLQSIGCCHCYIINRIEVFTFQLHYYKQQTKMEQAYMGQGTSVDKVRKEGDCMEFCCRERYSLNLYVMFFFFLLYFILSKTFVSQLYLKYSLL